MTKLQFTIAILLLILTIDYGTSRSVKEMNSSLLSDGLDHDQTNKSSLLQHDFLKLTVTCEPKYSFLPCTTTVTGQLFMLVVYEYLLSLSQEFVSNGSNLFFQMFGTGIFGGSLFQVLRIFPQIILILVSGLTATEETLQAMASNFMGLLAGSAILMLTLIWGSVIAFGSYDLSDSSSSSNDNKPFSLTGYGVTTDIETKYSAIIMLVSIVPLLLLQLAKILSSHLAQRIVVLICLIITVALLIGYTTYQIFEPWIQDRRLDYLMRRYIQSNRLGRLLSPNGKANEREIKKLFHRIDRNNNSSVSSTELKAFIVGMQIQEVGLDDEDFEAKILEELNISEDTTINESEFVKGVSNWLNKANNNSNNQAQGQRKFFQTKAKKNNEEEQSLLPAKKGSEKTTRTGTNVEGQAWWNYTKAAFWIILGTAIAMVLSNPLMSTLQGFATSINIPSFMVSYVVIPLALSFKLAVGSITSASQKTENAASLTFSELYLAVFMNNVMSLIMFLGVVFLRDISWGVSTDALVTLLICTTMGLFATFNNKIQYWTCIPVFLLYPMSLLVIYVLTQVLGWS